MMESKGHLVSEVVRCKLLKKGLKKAVVRKDGHNKSRTWSVDAHKILSKNKVLLRSSGGHLIITVTL